MDIFDILSLAGGLAMFLYGMRLMGDSLKENSSGALKSVMEKVTDNPFKAFVLGMLVTALIQSSTATIVITSGLVGAGILTFHQSLGIIIGANVGTTITGQIIRLLDLNASGGASWLRFFQPSTLAPVALIIGIVLIMGGWMKNAKSIGNIAIGFGILFSGLLNMTGSVNQLSQSAIVEKLFLSLGENPLIGYITGAGVAFVLQSSSATIGILQAFSATGLLLFKGVYSVIVGVYLGDCVTTAIVCSIGAKPDAKRVGVAHILFNLCKTILVLAGVTAAARMGFLDGLWDKPVTSGIIANTNTVFNLACAILLLPVIPVFEKLSQRIVKDEKVQTGKYTEVLDSLSPVFYNTPALALRSCYNVLMTMLKAARENLYRASELFEIFDSGQREIVQQEEDSIDAMTDHVSRYLVGLLPHVQLETHTNILNQYYQVISEFERLGDYAVHIADIAENLDKADTVFSETARKELTVLRSLLSRILDYTETTFRRRDVEAAWQIEPLAQVADEMVSQMRKNHLKRMSSGQCNLMADTAYSNLLMECKRIANACSNVGIATMVRAKPELADHEHLYYEEMRAGKDEAYNEAYNKARKHYFSMM